MTNAYGVVLDDASLRWATAESVPETVIAAICLLETRSVDEIVARLTPPELEQVIRIVGRCPRAYPPGAYEALEGHRRTPSPKPQPAEPERLHWRAKQTERATKHTHRWTPARASASERATTNPYGITLDRAWTEWAAKQVVSETIAAALYLLSENREAEAVVGKLNPSELEQVIDVIGHQPDRFPPATLAALKESRPTQPEVSSDPPGAGSHFRGRARLHGTPQRAPERAAGARLRKALARHAWRPKMEIIWDAMRRGLLALSMVCHFPSYPMVD
jgi:hypothetical protein